MHSFDAFGERRLPGTESGASPFWSPDSHSVGFFADRKLKTIEISNVAPQVLCDAPAGQGGTWNVAGTIVFAANLPGSLYRVSSKGGIPQPVSSADSSDSQTIRQRPHFFPDGRHFLYAAVSANPKNGGIFVGSLDSKEILRLAAGAEAAYADNAVLFVQDDVLLAQPFDPARWNLLVRPGESVLRITFNASRFQGTASWRIRTVNIRPADCLHRSAGKTGADHR